MRLRRLREFARDKDGATAIEFAFLAPVLLVVLTASVVIFLLFQASKNAEKATFTVADIISRRTSVDSTFLNTSYQLFLKMTNTTDSNVRFRISSIKKSAGAFSIDWSYAVAPQTGLATIPTDKLPLVSDGDSLILVETTVKPPAIGSFLPVSISDYANTDPVRPRFTAAISRSN